MFSKLIGNGNVKTSLRRLFTAGRLPGSMLFTGEAGIGKKLFALEVAKAINCRNRNGVEACDQCPSCKRISNSTFAPFGKEEDDKNRLIWSEHADVAMARPYKQIIRVPVMRELEREANFRPFEGSARFFIIEGAEYMNDQAANALLKTLEEPQPTSHLILTTTNPTALLPTIRSRCQVIRFAPIPAPNIENFLIERQGLAPADASLLAHTARGSIGRALSTDIEEYRDRRESMLTILKALTVTGDRVQLLRSSEDLAAAKDRGAYEESLDVLESLIRDAWSLVMGRSADALVNFDLVSDLQRCAEELSSRRAAEWISEIEELRGALEVNVNRRIASDGLLLSMAAR